MYLSHSPTLSLLNGCKIAIDTSNYLYKFKTQTMFMENVIKFCNLLNKFNITPIFVFDGKIPKIKKDELKLRLETKTVMREYADRNYLNLSEEEKIDFYNNTKIITQYERISFMKYIIDEKYHYVVSKFEADSVCYDLVRSKEADGCFSDDTDLIVYGCDKVYRNLDIENETIMCYNINTIYNTLTVTKKEFIELCIISGNDYTRSKRGNIFKNFNTLMKHNKLFRRQIINYRYIYNNYANVSENYVIN